MKLISHSARYLRRVAFGLEPGVSPPEDPVSWAKAQLHSVPPIAVLDADGQPRTDLPEGTRLLGSGPELMQAYQTAFDVEDDVFARGKTLSPAAYNRLREERLAIPYWRMEHWKEVQARASTAVHGSAPVFERLWHFWANHFMVAPGNQRNDVLVGPYQRMLREHMTGSYRDLLWHAVTHPGMLVYLDNNRNTGPNSRAARSRWTRDSVNENLGRELLELFTLSPKAGYTQQDVEATTLILTGWTVRRPDRWYQPGGPLGTHFDYDRHEPGGQTVLGKTYRALFRPSSKLEDLVTDLALHPHTAQHLARKLCVAFIDDDPPPQAVQAVQQAFVDSQGHLPAVHAALLQACHDHLDGTRKLTSPEAWFLQLHRVTGAVLPQVPPLPTAPAGHKTFHVLADLGQALPRCPQPNGWPILSRDWLSREMLDRRARWAQLMSPPTLRRLRETGIALQDLIDRQLSAGGADHRSVSAVLDSQDPARALALMWLAPEFLWS